MEQFLITSNDYSQELYCWFVQNGCRILLLVCDNSIRYQVNFTSNLKNIEKELGLKIIEFNDFQPNPLYEDVVKGVKLFREGGCEAIFAVGGGSAIDVAKCVKAYAHMGGSGDDGAFLSQEITSNNIPFLAMPTTAGTGSEATRFAVIYYKGEKQSITHESLIPGSVLLNPSCLKTLPPYQKKSTMMDALCHAIESFWSVNSTEESKEFSKRAIGGVLRHMTGYLNNSEEDLAGMLLAANTAGKAINITQTTAGHAMCYKITSLLGPSHGHAAILCDRVLFPWMNENTDKCIDPRGEEYLKKTLDEIGLALDCADAESGAEKLMSIFDSLGLQVPAATEQQYEILRTSVNPVRLNNHPVALDEKALDHLYHEILR